MPAMAYDIFNQSKDTIFAGRRLFCAGTGSVEPSSSRCCCQPPATAAFKAHCNQTRTAFVAHLSRLPRPNAVLFLKDHIEEDGETYSR